MGAVEKDVTVLLILYIMRITQVTSRGGIVTVTVSIRRVWA